LENGDRQAGRTPESKEANPLPRFYACNPQAAKSDDPGTQQRGSMHVIQTRRQRKSKVGPYHYELSITPIHRVPSKYRVVTKILLIVTAKPAVAIDATDPGNTDASSDWQIGDCAFDHLAHNLMPGNKLRTNRRKILFHDMQIGATDSTSNHT
jgi:hypothetical protein